jgi:phosphoribosyl-ATP pyrophosphohydrolase/phosphoribosyl-AMP cyclohydrolase/histidinol dehydrogenase
VPRAPYLSLSLPTQALHKIEADCDADALRFTVAQHGKPPAFCHRNCYCCWGGPRKGLGHLEQVLVDRKAAAPEGSYTKRLFEESALLRNKLVEEAQELAEAETFRSSEVS